jgi:hypothetical protein
VQVWKLESVEQRIDDVADVERQADRVDRIPHAEESDFHVGHDGVLLLELQACVF